MINGRPVSFGGSEKIGVTLNADGTQNLFISDPGTVLDLAAATADATASEGDVAEGKTFYAGGQKKVGASVGGAPTLLWTNPNPKSAFAAQTLPLNGAGYTGYLVEVAGYPPNESLYPGMGRNTGIAYIWMDESASDNYNQVIATQGRALDHNNRQTRIVTEATVNGITFTTGYNGTSNSNTAAIPLRIWGVNFVL